MCSEMTLRKETGMGQQIGHIPEPQDLSRHPMGTQQIPALHAYPHHSV